MFLEKSLRFNATSSSSYLISEYFFFAKSPHVSCQLVGGMTCDEIIAFRLNADKVSEEKIGAVRNRK